MKGLFSKPVIFNTYDVDMHFK